MQTCIICKSALHAKVRPCKSALYANMSKNMNAIYTMGYMKWSSSEGLGNSSTVRSDKYMVTIACEYCLSVELGIRQRIRRGRREQSWGELGRVGQNWAYIRSRIHPHPQTCTPTHIHPHPHPHTRRRMLASLAHVRTSNNACTRNARPLPPGTPP